MIGTEASDQLGNIAGATVLALITAAGAYFARRAARISRDLRAATTVPPQDASERETSVGEAIGALRKELTDAWQFSNAQTMRALGDLQDGQDEIGVNVQKMQVKMAHHDGQHEGLQRELDRLSRRVFNGRGDDDHRRGDT